MAAFAWFRRPTRNRHPHVMTTRRRRPRLLALEDRVVPATFDIPNGDTAALIAAINTSNGNTEADIINLAATGTYTFSAAADPADGGSALPSILANNGAAADTITINGNGATLTRDASAGPFRFFRVTGGLTRATLNLNALTLSNGDAGTNRGGAVFLANGSAAFTTCNFTGNRAGDGGAVGTMNTGGTLAFMNCTVTGNTATTGDGGGIQNQGATVVMIDGCTITGNSANSGGGISNQGGPITLLRSTVAGNQATSVVGRGGGISTQGDLTMSESSVSDNMSAAGSAGIFIQGNLTATDSAFNTNTAVGAVDAGGGIFIQGVINLTSCTVSGNTAVFAGGGIDAITNSGTSSFRFCTITGNTVADSSGSGGGLLLEGSGTFQLYNSVVAGNTFEGGGGRGATGPDIAGTVASLGFNFIGDGSGATIMGTTTGNQVGTTARPLDPRLGPLQSNGGRTFTRVPLAGSPLVNAGDPAFAPPPTNDQRGAPRVQGGRIDIGSVEVQPQQNADVSVTKTDGRTSITAGGTTTYTVVVRNVGPNTASGVMLSDAVPSAAASAGWTSTAAGGATGNTASGSGAISETVTLPSGASVTYSVTVTVSATATGSLTNTASVTLPSSVTDPNPANNSATDTDNIRTSGGGGANSQVVAVAEDAGGLPVVNLFDAQSGEFLASILAYDRSFTGGVRVALGDFNGDGVNDVVTAAGPGGGPHVRVFDGATGDELLGFFAYDPAFTGGVFVATGDINGDGVPDIVTGAGAGGGPHVKVFNSADLSLLASFFAYEPAFTGGVAVAAGDVNGDGVPDIVTGAGPGGGPHVKAFSGDNGTLLQSFFAYDLGFTGGVNVAAGDFNGDGRADIVTGPGFNGGPHLRVFDSRTGLPSIDFMAFPPGVPGSSLFSGNVLWVQGLRVAAADVSGDGVADLVAGPGPGRAATVRVFNGSTQDTISSFTAFDPGFLGGVFVGGT